MRVHYLLPALALLLTSASLSSAAEVALFYSTYQEKQFAYMPGEYAGQFNSAGACLKAAGFPWDRVDSARVEAGALLTGGWKVLVITYTSVMSPAEAAAIEKFTRQGGKLFVIYAGLSTPWTADGPGKPGRGLLADVMGMETAGTLDSRRCMRLTAPDSPLLALLPPYVYNPHGYVVAMKPLAGTKVLATWGVDEEAPAGPGDGALLVSPTTVYFSGFLWRMAEARVIVSNALCHLLGRANAAATVVWTRAREAAPIPGALSLPYQATARADVDAIAWSLAEVTDGFARPTCAVVYPVSALDVFPCAKRLALALRCPLVPDRAVLRDALEPRYDLILVGRLSANHCENPVGNPLLGIRDVLKEYVGTPEKAVIRLVPTAARPGARRLLLVAGGNQQSLERAEVILRQEGLTPRAGTTTAPPSVRLWQPANPWGNLVYPWSRAGEPISDLRLPAAISQQARGQFVVTTSATAEPAELDLALSPLTGPTGTFPAEQVKLLLTRSVKSNVTGIDEPHPLVPGRHFALDPAAHQQVWLIADCTGAKPGVYTGNLSLSVGPDGAQRPAASLRVTLDIAPITLAPGNSHRKLTCVWDYAIGGHLHGPRLSQVPGRPLAPDARTSLRWNQHYEQHFRDYWRAYVDDLATHGVNVMFLSPTMVLPQFQLDGRQIDEAWLKPLVAHARRRGFRLFIFTQILGQGCYYPDSDVIAGPDVPYGTPAWDEAYCRILRAYLDFTRKQGLAYSQWALYPFDEPHDRKNAALINHVAELAQRVDPHIQIWADPMRSAETDLDTLSFWKSLEKSVDIWWPADSYLAPGTDTLKYLQGLGKPFGIYRCGAYNTKNRPGIRPDTYYRLFGWQVVQRQASGMGFWTWCAWLGDSWDDEDMKRRDGDGAVIYEGPTGPITTLDWEAWGEGLDDYKYVEALEDRLKAHAPADAQLRAQAETVLREAVASSIKDIAQADAQRARIREMILKL